MKRFWKRVNRGLVLAAVILVGLVIFIQIDQYQFKSAKPEIEQMTREYLSRVKEINQLEPNERMKQTRLLLEEYWRDSNGLIMGEVKSGMEQYLDFIENEDFEKLEEYADRINGIEVKKSGPGAASVNVNYEVTLKGDERISLYGIYGLETSWYSHINGESDHTSESRVYDLTFQLIQEKDGWKISYISASYEMMGESANMQES